MSVSSFELPCSTNPSTVVNTSDQRKHRDETEVATRAALRPLRCLRNPSATRTARSAGRDLRAEPQPWATLVHITHGM